MLVGGDPQPYWRSPAHAGYFTRWGSSLDALETVSGGGVQRADGGRFDWLDDLIDLVASDAS